jgi:hypothetical protein
MNLRKAAISLAAATAIAGSAGIAAIVGPSVAGASTPPSGTQLPGAVVTLNPDPNTTFVPTAGTPYASGQTISVQIPTENTLSYTSNVQIIECADPGGLFSNLPTSAAGCDPAGTIQGDSFNINNGFTSSSIGTTNPSTGAFTYLNYGVFAENPSEGTPITCGSSTVPCVLLITTNYSDFSGTGHLWSQPFQVVDKSGLNDGANPGDGTPEVPLAIGLPLAAAGLFAGGLTIRRRRANKVRTA